MEDTAPPEDDEREIELSALCATFPEIVQDAEDPFTAFISLPVRPLVPLRISLVDDAAILGAHNGAAAAALDTHELAYLPPLHVKFSLPLGYPKSKPPNLDISTNPSWLPEEILIGLKAEGERLWEDFGHDQVLFTFLDTLQDAATNAFGITDGGRELNVSLSDKLALLDFNLKAKKEAFNKETFECGICLDPKKGSVCHRMLTCGHVFCVQCLQDFYNNAITTGDLATVRCLAPGCAKEQEAKSQKPRKAKTFISPGELLQIPLEYEMVKRYVTLKHKAQLESDKNTVYCPRKWCQGGARSKKHRKPEGLEIVDDSDSGSETEDGPKDTKGSTSQADLMRVCEDCSFAFCSRCFQGWHGEYFNCLPQTRDAELTADDKASLEYIFWHTSKCPSCACAAQKTYGCNHMMCSRCATHFCYLCSAWLPPDNPYKHYNVPAQGCYMRLWELEGGDGDDVGIGFAGGDHAPDEEFEDDDDEDVGDELNGAAAMVAVEPPVEERQLPPPIAPAAPVIARHVREGPLVIRLDLPARPPDQPPAPVPPVIGRRQAAAVNRLARGEDPVGRNGRRNVAQGQRLDEDDRVLPRRQARGPNLPQVAHEPQHENNFIQDARRVFQAVAQRAQQNDPAVGQLLGRPPPAHENMNHAELVQRREWLERFMELAVNDEEDDWASDEDDEDDHMWEIQPR